MCASKAPEAAVGAAVTDVAAVTNVSSVADVVAAVVEAVVAAVVTAVVDVSLCGSDSVHSFSPPLFPPFCSNPQGGTTRPVAAVIDVAVAAAIVAAVTEVSWWLGHD